MPNDAPNEIDFESERTGEVMPNLVSSESKWQKFGVMDWKDSCSKFVRWRNRAHARKALFVERFDGGVKALRLRRT